MTINRLVFVAILAGSVSAAQAQPPVFPGAAAKPARIPSSWFTGHKEYAKAVELQKTTGADILLMFYRMAPTDEKGLWRWLETKGLSQQKVAKKLDDYIKVKILLDNSDEVAALATKFYVKKSPRLFVIHPDGQWQDVKPFDWPGGKPEIASADELLARLVQASSPAPTAAAPAP